MTWDEIPHHPLGAAPDALEGPLYRQIVAKRALIAGYEEPEQTAQTITDALADLRHLCDGLGLDFAALDKSAYASYLEEVGQVRQAPAALPSDRPPVSQTRKR